MNRRSGWQQLIHTRKGIATLLEFIEQRCKAMMHLVRSARTGTDVQQQKKTIQPHRIARFALENALQNGRGGHKIGLRLKGVVCRGPGSRGEIDQRETKTVRPLNNLAIVVFESRQKETHLSARHPETGEFQAVILHIGYEFTL